MATVPKTAVIGASGYVGRHLWRAYRAVHSDCLGTSFSRANPDLLHFDLRQPNLAVLRLEEQGYRAVLISSAKPNVAYCEQEKAAAYEVNVRGTLDLIEQIGRTSMQTIFLSSDYVFPGDTGGYDDDAPTQPTTEYGRHKAEVERQMPALCGNYLVLRLSKIFGVQKGENTLLDEIAAALLGGREVRAARDQIFSPTYVDDLERAVLAVQTRGLRGVVNVCNPQRWSRAEIAAAVAGALPQATGRVATINLHDIPAMAGRPLNTSMACSRLQREVGAQFTPLTRCIEQIAAAWQAA